MTIRLSTIKSTTLLTPPSNLELLGYYGPSLYKPIMHWTTADDCFWTSWSLYHYLNGKIIISTCTTTWICSLAPIPFSVTAVRCFASKRRKDEDDDESYFQVLACLFLVFGLAMPREQLRPRGLDILLLQARLLVRFHPLDANYLVAEVQIYPLHVDAFEESSSTRDQAIMNNNDVSLSSTSSRRLFFFMTDFNLESMRLPRDAITCRWDTIPSSCCH
jgi:hypothetical protein